jgi:universal stress protein F
LKACGICLARKVDVERGMNRILVALDNSEITHLVLDRAIELAHATDAKLRLMRVVPERVEPAPPTQNIPQNIPALITHTEAELGAYEVRIPAKYRDGVVVVAGQPFEAICKVARSYNADVVVIGAHRYGVLDRMLGTTAAKVVNHIDRPVLIVRPVQARQSETQETRPHSFLAEHPMMDAATLAGAISGAAAGALAGPPGAIAGGIIGTAIGAMAGSALDREDRRTGLHDRELDDAIGVTKGDLGARERAVAALIGVSHEERDDAARRMTSLAKMLRAEHQRLEGAYDGLLSAYRSGSWEIVRTQWAQFEPSLRAHMDLEEKLVFPAFRLAASAEADALAEEHAHMRKLLDTLGIAVELHAMPQGDAEELVLRLREHGQREERILYPWLEEQPRAHTADALGKLSAA